MDICYATLYPFGFSSRIKHSPLDILKIIFTTLSNNDKKVEFVQVDEDGVLTRSFEFMNTCHNMNMIVKTTGEDAYSIDGKSESPNKTLYNITRDLLLNSSHKK